MIKKLFLPNSPGKLELASHPLARPLLPCLHERRQAFRIQLCRTEEVNMIRHDDITPDRPAVAFARLLPFVEAWVRVRGSTSEAKAEARAKFLPPIYQHLNEAGLGHISEICDAEPPHTPRGCPFQAWSLGELLRLERSMLA